jgi:hypothetical protein
MNVTERSDRGSVIAMPIDAAGHGPLFRGLPRGGPPRGRIGPAGDITRTGRTGSGYGCG